jgi:hypothetical protein
VFWNIPFKVVLGKLFWGENLQNKIALCTILVIVLSGMLLAATANAATAEPDSTTLKVTAADGKEVTLTINGNVAADQISELWYANNAAIYNNTDIAFKLTSQGSTDQFMNMTVPKNALLDNTAPIVTINGVWVKNSGYTQDSSNVYVWFTATSTTEQIDRSDVQITFLLKPNVTAIGPSLNYLYTVGLLVASLLVAMLFIMITYSRRCNKRFQQQVKLV